MGEGLVLPGLGMPDVVDSLMESLTYPEEWMGARKGGSLGLVGEGREGKVGLVCKKENNYF